MKDIGWFPTPWLPVLRDYQNNTKFDVGQIYGINPNLWNGFLYHTTGTGALSINSNIVTGVYSGDGLIYTSGATGNVYLYVDTWTLSGQFVPYTNAQYDVVSPYSFKSTAGSSGTHYEYPYSSSYNLYYYPVTPSTIGGYSSGYGSIYDDWYWNIYASYYWIIATIDYNTGVVTDTTGGYISTNYIYYSYTLAGSYAEIRPDWDINLSGYLMVGTGIRDGSGYLSIDTNNKKLYDATGNEVADWSKSTYTYGVSIPTLQTDNIFPVLNSSVSFWSWWDVDVYLRDIYAWTGGGNLYDTSSYKSADWSNRVLYDNTGTAILDYSNQYSGGLLSGNGSYWIDFNNACLVDTATSSLDWNNHLLYASGAIYGMVLDWQNQQLYHVDGASVQTLSLDWANRKAYASDWTTEMINWNTAWNVSFWTNDIEITSSSSWVILQSPDTTRWRLQIDNSGTITATSL